VSDDDRAIMHRFCPNCGTEAVAGASFCAACGSSLINPAALTDEPHDESETGEHRAEEGSDSIIPNVTWDFSDWDDAIQGDLGAALLRNKIPHRWEGTTLSTEPDYENQVDAILDEFCGLSDQDLSEAEIESGEEDNREDDDEVTWETPGWTSDTRGEFTSTLLAADISHYWDGTTLITDAQYEDRVDSIMDALYGTLSEDGPPQNQPDANEYESDFPAGGSGGRAAWIVAAVFIVLGAGAGAIVFVAHHHSGSTSASPGAGVSTGAGNAPSASVPTAQNTVPTSSQLSAAYQSGYVDGQGQLRNSGVMPNRSESTIQFLCQSGPYQNAQLKAQYFDGCMAGNGY